MGRWGRRWGDGGLIVVIVRPVVVCKVFDLGCVVPLGVPWTMVMDGCDVDVVFRCSGSGYWYFEGAGGSYLVMEFAMCVGAVCVD